LTSTAYVLVTSSRTLASYRYRWVASVLLDVWHDARQDGYQTLTVVHGAARGGDKLADRWALQHAHLGVDRREFPADWEADCIPGLCKPGHRRTWPDGTTFCPAEGTYRNQRMVDHLRPFVPAVVCVALFAAATESTGTADCARRAEAAGIPVRRLHAPARPVRPKAKAGGR
jgi:hypothetical protein